MDLSNPFELGKTWYDGRTIDTANLGGIELEGQEREFKDIDLSNTATVKPERTPFLKRCRVVRNVSGIAILPKRCVTYQATAGNYGKRVDGYADVTNERIAGVVDEFLPSAGCPNNDLCWITVEGPCIVLTDLAAVAGNVISVGNYVGALTAVTSQATTAGRASLLANSTGATGPLFDAAANYIGHALSARTTDNTNSDLLIYKNGGKL